MLDRLVSILKTNGPHTVHELAEKLGTTPALVQMMLDDLARRGYLRRVNESCDSKCAGCSLRIGCVLNPAGLKYMLNLPIMEGKAEQEPSDET